MNSKQYKIILLVVVLVTISSVFLTGGVTVCNAATSKKYDFDNTNILDDLATATINGEKFNIINYLPDSTGLFKHPEIFTVVEFCYSYDMTNNDNYGLYIYFYNPQKLNIDTASSANKVSLGVKYSTDKNGYLKVDDYEKFDLKFCSKSTGKYKDLFYKFKILDHKSADGKYLKERVERESRRYDFCEVELVTVGDKNATAYGIGGTYTFEGFAKGFGENETDESTLTCKRNDIETITLDLAGITDGVDKRTYWRSKSSSLGKNHQNQINSVFFAIDTDILEKYGYSLQKIKAEWWEYKTAPVVVADSETYALLEKYKGEYDYNVVKDFSHMLCTVPYKFERGSYKTDRFFTYGWNVPMSEKGGIYTNYSNCDLFGLGLPLLFDSNGKDVDKYTISAKELEEYITNYNSSEEYGRLQFNNHDFSADLFMNRSSDGIAVTKAKYIADDGRTAGYNCREFDVTNPDDLWQINSYNSNHNWLNKLLDYGFGKITTNDDYTDILPIQMIDDSDLNVSDIADHLLINEKDVERFKKFYKDSTADKNHDGKRDKEVFIFRYAQTDYYAEDLCYLPKTAFNADAYYTFGEAEVRQETVFFDFDVMTMAFNKKGELITLGCVSSPVDHITELTPSVEAEHFDWKRILTMIIGLLIFILLLLLLYPILVPLISALFKGLIWLVILPFKAISKLVKTSKKKE